MTSLRFSSLAAAAAAAAISLGLAGCASGPASPADESASFAPVDYKSVCLLENERVKSPKLVEAIESGLKKGGAQVKRLPAGSGPGACPFVLTYEVHAEKGVINAIFYQTFENGIPRLQATGRAPQGRGLTVAAVEAYTQELLARLEGRYPADGAAKPAERPAYMKPAAGAEQN